MKKAIIIGATSGIGLEVARLLLRRGWRIGVAGRREEALQALRSTAPERVETARIDVTCDDAPERLRALIDRLGGMDLFFLSSGIGYQNPALDPDIELRTALESAPLDEIIANGETEMRICRLANMYAELRGIVSEDELIDEIAAQDLGTGYTELFARHGKRRAVEALLTVNFEGDMLDSDILDDGETRWYIFHTLSDDAGTAPDDPWAAPAVVKAPLPPMLQNLLKARQSKPVRHLEPEMAACNTLYDWELTLPEVQKLIGFLDANVPDDADDYFYADRVYDSLEEMSRGGYPPNAVLQYVSDEEIIPDKAGLKPFLDILMNFLNVMPNWANNGWSPNDILPSDAQMS